MEGRKVTRIEQVQTSESKVCSYCDNLIIGWHQGLTLSDYSDFA